MERDEPLVFKREVIVPVVPKQWVWTYLLVKGALIAIAMVSMAFIAR